MEYLMSVRPPGVTSILQAVEQRGETDTQPSYFVHVILPFLITVVAVLLVLGVVIWQVGSIPEGVSQIPDQTIGAIAAAVIVGVIGVIVAVVLTFRGWYLLIDRRNGHLARDRILRQGLLDYCRRVAETEGDDRAGDHLESMQRLHNEALLEENERPAVVHLLLYVLTNGLWGLYVLWFLLKDLPRHGRRQARFVREARGVFEDAGRNPETIPEVDPTNERSFLLSLALWIFLPIVGGFIVTWWLYKDPPEHFERQWSHEDQVIELVQGEGLAPPPDASEEGEPDDPEALDDEPDDETDGAPETDQAAEEDGEAPEFTIWTCGECGKKYKVPPKRPVRVTCKECGHKEILGE